MLADAWRALVIAGTMVAFAGCGATGSPRHEVAGGDPDRGAAHIRTYGCGSCHTIPGIPGARAVVGPPLWGIADRTYLGGVIANTPSGMIRWLQDPPAVDPRTAMPDLGITEQHARDISSYLYRVRAEPPFISMVRGFVQFGSGTRAVEHTGWPQTGK